MKTLQQGHARQEALDLRDNPLIGVMQGLWKILTFGAVIVVLWGVAGVLQLRSDGSGGYATGWGAEVAEVEEGGPAATAGLEPGDRILAVGGARVANPWTRPERASVGAGGTQSLQIERAGETRSVEIAWEAVTRSRWGSILRDSLVTLAFLGFGLWAFRASGTTAGLVLAVFGLCYALANLRGPSLPSVDVVLHFAQRNLSALTTVILFHFFMVFPRMKTVVGRPVSAWLLYVPFLALLLLGLAAWVFDPSSLDGYPTVAAAIDLLYMALAVSALLHSRLTISRTDRRDSGFDRVVAGLVVAIGPFLALALVRALLPRVVVPGVQYLPLLGAVIPGSMAWAVVAGARSKRRAGN